MAYVRYFSKIKREVIDEFLFAKYLETYGKRVTIFKCLQEYLNKYVIPLENIIVIAADGFYNRKLSRFGYMFQRKSA